MKRRFPALTVLPSLLAVLFVLALYSPAPAWAQGDTDEAARNEADERAERAAKKKAAIKDGKERARKREAELEKQRQAQPLTLPNEADDKVKLVKTKSGAMVYTSDNYDDPTPKRVAVLPFGFPGDNKLAGRTVYQSFRNHFFGLPFGDVEWHALESAMVRLGLNPTQQVPANRLADVAREVGADAVITGRVKHLDATYLGIYGQISARMEVRMVRIKTGRTLWAAEHTVTHRKGKVPFSILELVVALVSTALSLDEKAKMSVVDELGRAIASEVPILEGMAEQQGVKILAAAHSARPQADAELPKVLKAGDTVRFAARLDRKARVRVQIGPKTSLLLQPQKGKDNTYVGVYRVRPGEDMSGGTVSFIAFDKLGNKAEYIDAFAPINIDTVPPKPPTGLRVRYLNKKMTLTWAATPAKDVVAYDIYRSRTPLTGFKKISRTEFTRFVDEKPLSTIGHYKVVARDWAGNLSPRSEMAIGRVIKAGPTTVSGVIADDTVWRAAASPYILDGIVTVANQVRLIVEPGTEIHARPGSKLRVKGQLVAKGEKGAPIIWIAKAKRQWGGLEISYSVAGKESILSHNRISGAKVAIAITAASPKVEYGSFIKNGTALSISDNAEPVILANNIRANRIGILIDTADPVIEGNVIYRNREIGIDAVAARPLLSGNDLSGNGGFALRIRDQAKGGIVMAERNWWGEVEGENIRKLISGAASYYPFLNAAPPHGKAVEFTVAKLIGGAKRPLVQTLDSTKIFQTMLEGFALMDKGDLAGALKKLTQVAPYARKNALLHYRLALIRFATGDYQGARKSVDKAIAVNDQFANYHTSKGMILRALGLADEARAAFEMAVKLNPKDRTAHRLLKSG